MQTPFETPFSSCCVYYRSLSSREEAYVGRSEIYSASQKKKNRPLKQRDAVTKFRGV